MRLRFIAIFNWHEKITKWQLKYAQLDQVSRRCHWDLQMKKKNGFRWNNYRVGFSYVCVGAIIQWHEEMVEFDEFECWKPFEMILITFDPLTTDHWNGFKFWILVTIDNVLISVGHQTRWAIKPVENKETLSRIEALANKIYIIRNSKVFSAELLAKFNAFFCFSSIYITEQCKTPIYHYCLRCTKQKPASLLIWFANSN